MTFSEEELIKGCKKGKRAFQKALYEHYADGMFLVALRYAKAQQEAEDILQDSFVKVFKHIGKFREDSSLAFWIKRIVVNTALNHQRGKLYLYPMVDVHDLDRHSERSEALENIAYEELLEMIQDLPAGCQVVFNLYAIEGFKHNEIAKMLEISEGTSKSQYSRARTILARKIQKREKINYASGEI
ncbi:MAG: RNA polymerase sigma factor [Bacteroidota bacterium]